MQRIYQVEFDEKWKGCSWVGTHLKVPANGDGREAIRKARKHALKQTFVDENGKVQKCIGWRFTGLRVLAESDI